MFQLTEEQLTIQDLVRTYAQGPIKALAEEIDKTGRVPEENIQGLVDLGILQLTIPEEYGGTMDAYTVLLAPDRCEGLYTAYLCAQMDFINGEIARYNNDMEIFSAEWDAYAAYLYRTRTHKKSPSFTAL